MDRYDTLTINNHPHFTHVWGDEAKPLLLLVHGGPGTPSLSFFRRWNKPLEAYFMMASYDQRGTGRSYFNNIDRDKMTVDQLLDDLLEITRYLLKTYEKEKVFILGHSFGTILSLKAVYKHPEYYHSYYSVSQFVNMEANEQLCYNWVKEVATKRGDKKVLNMLETVGQPTMGLYKDGFSSARKVKQAVGKYKGDARGANANMRIFTNLLFSKEYGGVRFPSTIKSMMVSLEVIGPDMRRIDFPSEIMSVDVPIYFFSGDYDHLTPQVLLRDYYKKIEAPRKELYIFENSAHSPLWEEQEKFTKIMAKLSVIK